MHHFHTISQRLLDSLTDDEKRIDLQNRWIYAILAVVSTFMTVVNILTNKKLLTIATLLFAILSMVNIILARLGGLGKRISTDLFLFEILSLFTFFIISGTPEGFSAIWICLLPSSGLLLFGRKRGIVLCTIMLLIILFFFDTPYGVSLLQYPYNETFRMRFPMLYIAFFAISFFLETVRALTQQKLLETQQKYEYLYAHDALTGLYNRYGFNERIDSLLRQSSARSIGMMVLDIDHFKRINDRYGHISGDAVLKQLAAILREALKGEAEVCRWGGEEFAVLYSGQQPANERVNEILCTIRQTPFHLDGYDLAVTVSAGVVTIPSGVVVTQTQLFVQTDACLYQAKESGRDRSVCSVYDAFANLPAQPSD